MIKNTEKKPKNPPVEADSDEEIPDLEDGDASFELPHPVELPDEERRAIALLQREIEAAELKQIRTSVPIFKPLYDRRNTLINTHLKKHDFWSRVFCTAPKDILDAFTLPDSTIISSLLRSFSVERISVDADGKTGDPRDLRFVFEFATAGDEVQDDNIYFENGSEKTLRLEKTFYWRKHITGTGAHKQMWEGLVSTPVRIPWKKGADPTKGLLDAACDLFDAEQKLVSKSGKRITGAERTGMAEYEALVSRLEKAKTEIADAEEGEGDDDSAEEVKLSFFNWFGYRGRDITAEESVAAMKEDDERWAKLAKGEAVDEEHEGDGCCGGCDDDEDDEDEGDEGMDDAEIYPDGEELALALADDLWPKALPYFGESFEEDEDDEEDESGIAALLRAVNGEGEEGEDDEEEFDGVEEVEEEQLEQPPKKKSKKTA
ncbi:hypothetical protein KEM56_003480 [Ascosphaera pollenicola]|nr:hypothetical protein KEM56_003480 [Ascosphaera pollenicola]